MNIKRKTAIVTGASSGIGRACAKRLAKLGMTVIMLTNDKAEGEIALNEIKKESKNEFVDLFIVDLSSLEEIKKFARDFKAKFSNLHVLLNNAGVYLTKRHKTADELEATFVINYLSRFLLTNLLLDVLKSSAPSRIIEVAGACHTKGQIDFDDLQVKTDYSGSRANNQAKLANIMFTHELARRLAGEKVTINSLRPGIVGTNIILKDKDRSSFLKFMYEILRPFIKTSEKGAQTSIFLSTSQEVEGVNGKYFVNNKEVKSSKESYDELAAKRLWETSEKLVGLNFSE